MSKIENWGRSENVGSALAVWSHDNLDYDIRVERNVSSGYDVYLSGDNAVNFTPDTEKTDHYPSRDKALISNESSQERAMDVARDFADKHPMGNRMFGEGDVVPIMTQHGDVTNVEVVDHEPEKNTVVIRALEDDKRIGFMEGDETAVDAQEIEDAMDLEPYERRKLENEFQRQQNMMEGRE